MADPLVEQKRQGFLRSNFKNVDVINQTPHLKQYVPDKMENYTYVQVSNCIPQGQNSYFLNILLYLLLSGSTKFHTYVISDFEISKC